MPREAGAWRGRGSRMIDASFLVAVHVSGVSKVRVEALIEYRGRITGAGKKFALGPIGNARNVFAGQLLNRADDLKIDTYFAEPNVALARRWANVVRSLGDEVEVLRTERFTVQSSSSLQAIGQGTGGHGKPHGAPLADAKLEQGPYREYEYERWNHWSRSLQLRVRKSPEGRNGTMVLIPAPLLPNRGSVKLSAYGVFCMRLSRASVAYPTNPERY
jgi:hypothetical protein